MTTVHVLPSAALRINEIYRYTYLNWGEAQAERYVAGLFGAIEKLETQISPSRSIPASIGLNGFYIRYEKHLIYWQRFAKGDIGIFSVLHEKMHQTRRLQDDLRD